MNRKLVEISEVMADGYLWLKMRALLEWFERNRDSDESSDKICEVVEQFHRLCEYVKKEG